MNKKIVTNILRDAAKEMDKNPSPSDTYFIGQALGMCQAVKRAVERPKYVKKFGNNRYTHRDAALSVISDIYQLDALRIRGSRISNTAYWFAVAGSKVAKPKRVVGLLFAAEMVRTGDAP